MRQYELCEDVDLSLDDLVRLDLVEIFYFKILHSNLCRIAARYGKIDTLIWLRKQNPPYSWDATTCNNAIKFNQFKTLKWLRKHKCPWNSESCEIAASTENLKILIWLRKQNPPCPWNRNRCFNILRGKNIEIPLVLLYDER
jgi:hypothetical protein